MMFHRASLLMLVVLVLPSMTEHSHAWAQHVIAPRPHSTFEQTSPQEQIAPAWEPGERQIRKPQPIFADELPHAQQGLGTVPLDADLAEGTLEVHQWEAPIEAHLWETPCSEPSGSTCGHCQGVCRCPGHPAKPRRQMPGDIDRGDCPPVRYQIDQRLRSGDPGAVYKWAQPTYTPKYSAWYVGGGGGFIKGRSRTAEEGTWGLDYNGLFGHAKVWLNYTCDRYQGGEGAYQTEHESLRPRFHHSD